MDASPTNILEPFSRCGEDALRAELKVPVTFPPLRDTVCMSTRSTTFHELYSRYADDVYRFAHWLTGNPHDARDITSETFVRVWTAAEEPRMEDRKSVV